MPTMCFRTTHHSNVMERIIPTVIIRRSLVVLLVPALVFLLPVCSNINIFPVSEDKALGASLDAQIRANPKEYPILRNASAQAYVQRMIDRVIASPDVKYRKTFAYTVEIINDVKTINAFCTPGGYIYVYTGLLNMLDNEAALAGVLGHEIAHAELRHSTSRMTKAYGVQLLMDLALGNDPNRMVELAANAFAGLGLLMNSRDDEMEADDYSFRYLRSTSWYPGGIKYFFENVKKRPASDLERLLSTHPLPQDRIDATNERLRRNNIPSPSEAQLNSRAYAEFKRSIGGPRTGR
ncbi:MAG: peptidase M48 [Candidatus Kapabacteria bacterium]|nr:peptidase M48 [Candidatus Kapabacteria bacterium]